MNKIPKVLCLIFSTIIISCNSSNEENLSENNNIAADTIQQSEIKSVEINSDSIIKKLEGEWKETKYPFRVAHFRNATVKFIEEGLVETPTFKEFKILKDCPYEVNNLRNKTNDDILLVMEENKTCEIVKIKNDTLILSGFNAHTNSDYDILYKRVK